MTLEIQSLEKSAYGKTVVEARFYVSSIKSTPIQVPLENADGSIKPWSEGSRTLIGGTVEMGAAKHGTFGKATPSGSCQMLIQNEHAFEVFKEAFERIIKEKGRTPRFKVYFVEDENQEPDK